MAKSDLDSAIELRLPLPLLVFQLHSALNAQARALISKRGDLSLAQWRVLRLISLDVAHASTALRKLMGIDKSQFSKEIGAMVALLASDGGAFINGQLLQVNGGAET